MTLEGMIETLRAKPYEIQSERVLEAMRAVPREFFVPEDWRHAAYADRALPIGYEQTISQPYIVALMTEMLDPQPTDRVLEIGTGSGYQTAILAQMVAHVYSVEIVGALVDRAREILDQLEITNVSLRHGNGTDAWVEEAPFDRILVACAPREVPLALRAQLAEGGRMVYPAGESEAQKLYQVDREQGVWQTRERISVRFVPMTTEVR